MSGQPQPTPTPKPKAKPVGTSAGDSGEAQPGGPAAKKRKAEVESAAKKRKADQKLYLGIDLGTTSPRPREQTRRVARQAGRAGGTPWPTCST